MCVSTGNVVGSDPCEAEQPVPGRAEDRGAGSRVAARRAPAPGHPPAPKPCLGTAGGNSSWHRHKLCRNQATPAA